MRRYAACLALCGSAWWSSTPAAAAAPAARPAKPGVEAVFEESTQLLVVEVPVNVVGRDGQPVRGLTAADFELLDDGVRQNVAGMEVVDLATVDGTGA